VKPLLDFFWFLLTSTNNFINIASLSRPVLFADSFLKHKQLACLAILRLNHPKDVFCVH
jgi:hypothetical protein